MASSRRPARCCSSPSTIDACIRPGCSFNARTSHVSASALRASMYAARPAPSATFASLGNPAAAAVKAVSASLNRRSLSAAAPSLASACGSLAARWALEALAHTSTRPTARTPRRIIDALPASPALPALLRLPRLLFGERRLEHGFLDVRLEIAVRLVDERIGAAWLQLRVLLLHVVLRAMIAERNVAWQCPHNSV